MGSDPHLSTIRRYAAAVGAKIWHVLRDAADQTRSDDDVARHLLELKLRAGKPDYVIETFGWQQEVRGDHFPRKLSGKLLGAGNEYARDFVEFKTFRDVDVSFHVHFESGRFKFSADDLLDEGDRGARPIEA